MGEVSTTQPTGFMVLKSFKDGKADWKLFDKKGLSDCPFQKF
jgi:hypothetical protein